MCYLVKTITQCSQRGSIATSTKALKSCSTNTSRYKLLSRLSFSLYMPGTHAPFPEPTSLAVLLQLAKNLPSPLTTLLESIGNSRLPPPPWSLTPRNWLRAWPSAAPSLNFSWRNSACITENSLTPPNQTLGFTELAILFLHNVQSNPFCAKNRWTSCNMHSRDLGEWRRCYPVPLIVLSTVSTKAAPIKTRLRFVALPTWTSSVHPVRWRGHSLQTALQAHLRSSFQGGRDQRIYALSILSGCRKPPCHCWPYQQLPLAQFIRTQQRYCPVLLGEQWGIQALYSRCFRRSSTSNGYWSAAECPQACYSRDTCHPSVDGGYHLEQQSSAFCLT